MKVTRTETCPECDGTGWYDRIAACEKCDSTGKLRVAVNMQDAVERSPGLEAFDAWCDDFLDGQGA